MRLVYLIYVLLVAFIVLTIVSFVLVLKSQRKQKSRKYLNNRDIELKKQITILNNKDLSGKDKASAFVSLMCIGYVLVHIMINTGNFDDYQQQKRFNKLVSSRFIERIDSLGDSDGQYSF